MPASDLSRQRRRDLEREAAALLRRIDPPFTRQITASLLGMSVPQVRAAEMRIAKILVQWGHQQTFEVPIHHKHD